MPRLLKASDLAELLGMSASQVRKSKEADEAFRLFGAKSEKWRQRRYIDSNALRLWAKYRRENKLASMGRTAVRRALACSLTWSVEQKRRHLGKSPMTNQDLLDELLMGLLRMKEKRPSLSGLVREMFELNPQLKVREAEWSKKPRIPQQ